MIDAMVSRRIVSGVAVRTQRLWRTALGKTLLVVNAMVVAILASVIARSDASADGSLALVGFGTFILALGLWAGPRGTGRWSPERFKNDRADAGVLLGIGLCALGFAGLAAALFR